MKPVTPNLDKQTSELQPGYEALYTGTKGWRALGGRIHSKDEPRAEDLDEWEAVPKAWHVRRVEKGASAPWGTEECKRVIMYEAPAEISPASG